MLARALILFLVPLQALAIQCTKVEYADARDWPVDKLEQAYCRTQYAAELTQRSTREMAAMGGLSTPANAARTRDYIACIDEADKYARILENVRQRTRPACEQGKPAPH